MFEENEDMFIPNRRDKFIKKTLKDLEENRRLTEKDYCELRRLFK